MVYNYAKYRTVEKRAICYARAKMKKKVLILHPKAQRKINKKAAVFFKNTGK